MIASMAHALGDAVEGKRREQDDSIGDLGVEGGHMRETHKEQHRAAGGGPEQSAATAGKTHSA
jgi:hypothetical protein